MSNSIKAFFTFVKCVLWQFHTCVMFILIALNTSENNTLSKLPPASAIPSSLSLLPTFMTFFLLLLLFEAHCVKPRSPVWPWAWYSPQEPDQLLSGYTTEDSDCPRIYPEPVVQQKADCCWCRKLPGLRCRVLGRDAVPSLWCVVRPCHAMPGQ